MMGKIFTTTSSMVTIPKSKARIKWLRYDQNKWNGPFILFEGYVSPGLSITGDTMFMENGSSFISVRTIQAGKS